MQFIKDLLSDIKWSPVKEPHDDPRYFLFAGYWLQSFQDHSTMLPFSGEGPLTAPRNIADIILYDVPHEAEHICEWWMLFRDQASLE